MFERDIESYGKGIPYLPNTKVNGRLTVIEGPDASDRSTHNPSYEYVLFKTY